MLCFVDQWCKKWKLSIYSSKTKIVHFRKSRKKLTDRDFHVGEHHINVVNAYKYLGVVFNEHLNLSE